MVLWVLAILETSLIRFLLINTRDCKEWKLILESQFTISWFRCFQTCGKVEYHCVGVWRAKLLKSRPGGRTAAKGATLFVFIAFIAHFQWHTQLLKVPSPTSGSLVEPIKLGNCCVATSTGVKQSLLEWGEASYMRLRKLMKLETHEMYIRLKKLIKLQDSQGLPLNSPWSGQTLQSSCLRAGRVLKGYIAFMSYNLC